MTTSPSQATLDWRKNTYSGTGQGHECVETAALPDGTVAVRNSTNPEAGSLLFTRAEIRAWIAGVKAGEFDDLT